MTSSSPARGTHTRDTGVGPKLYYRDELVELWHGDCRDVLPTLGRTFSACVCDPPYGETSAAWDHWPAGWVDGVSAVLPTSASLWCFGSARMFLDHPERILEFRAAGFKYSQEKLWVKRNGTGPTSRDRLVRVHEWAYQWYRGRWSDLQHEWEREQVGVDKGTVRKLARAAEHQRDGRQNAWTDDGTRQPHSVTYVIEAPSVRYQKRHQDEKPLATVAPLVRECTPPGGVVLDPFAGACTTGVAAKMLGLRAVLIEADERTCEIGARRLAEDLLPMGEAS